VIALVFGLAAGILGFTGVYVVITFFIALFLLSYIYYSKVLDINEEDFG
jgi:membrane protein implicated in regulation of membrane protease activity